MGVRERGDIDRCEVNAELAGIFGEKAACARVKKRGVPAVLDKNRETPFAFAKPLRLVVEQHRCPHLRPLLAFRLVVLIQCSFFLVKGEMDASGCCASGFLRVERGRPFCSAV